MFSFTYTCMILTWWPSAIFKLLCDLYHEKVVWVCLGKLLCKLHQKSVNLKTQNVKFKVFLKIQRIWSVVVCWTREYVGVIGLEFCCNLMLNKKEQKTYVGIDEKYGKLYMRNLLISLEKNGCFWLFFFYFEGFSSIFDGLKLQIFAFFLWVDKQRLIWPPRVYVFFDLKKQCAKRAAAESFNVNRRFSHAHRFNTCLIYLRRREFVFMFLVIQAMAENSHDVDVLL